MSDTRSKFEEIIGDVDAFQLMLDGAFKDWVGSYDVLLSDTGEYLFSAKSTAPRFRPFCQKLRSKTEGEARCWECDRDATMHIREQQRPVVYQCHSGLIDIAVPIFVDNELLATVFCGQVRPMNESEEAAGQMKAKQLEQDLGFAPGELISLWESIPRIPATQIEHLVQRVVNLVNYVAELGHERLELKKALRRDEQRLKENASIEKIARELSSLAVSWDEFWQRVQDVLKRVIDVVGARRAIILIPAENGSPNNSELVAKAAVNLPEEHFKNQRFAREDETYRVVLEKDGFALIPYAPDPHPDTVWGSVWESIPELTHEIAAAIRIRFDDRRVGMLVLFLNELQDESNSLPIQEERGLLTQLAFLIGAAYQNCARYQEHQHELVLRNNWLRRVTHQLIAPLHGVQGYAEDAHERLVYWKKEGLNPLEPHTEQGKSWISELRRWENSFESIVSSARHAARLAHNLEWVVNANVAAPNSDLIYDLSGILIKSARDFQGLARERRLRHVYVDKESIRLMNNKLCLDLFLFRQAIGNLLENAIKYSKRGATVTVLGRLLERAVEIYVTNSPGIRIHPEEVETIFGEGQRTREARLVHPTGTGIGLTVARDIIELHGGTLAAQPSDWTSDGWETTFVITLPISVSGCG